jgi:hypothetical protein
MAAAIPLAGGALSAYGDIQQGQMTSDSLNEQARNLTAQAVEAEQKGQFDAMRQQLLSDHKIGASIAAYGASGVAANSGSALNVIQASHMNSELDRLNILHGADIRAINYQNQASMNRYGADSARLGSYWKALGAMTMGMVHADVGAGAAKPGGEGAGLDEGAAEEGVAGADSGAAMAGVV